FFYPSFEMADCSRGSLRNNIRAERENGKKQEDEYCDRDSRSATHFGKSLSSATFGAGAMVNWLAPKDQALLSGTSTHEPEPSKLKAWPTTPGAKVTPPCNGVSFISPYSLSQRCWPTSGPGEDDFGFTDS